MDKSVRFYVGTSGWTYQDWRGLFYPDDLPQKKWLGFYAKHFPIVELNATFYRFFTPEIYDHWRAAVPARFKYVIKVPRFITHSKMLLNCEDYIESFEDSVSYLDKKLGLLLLQLSPYLPYDLNRIEKAITAFRNRKKLVVEFRRPEYLTIEVKQLLTQLDCIFCAADSPATKLVDWVTSDIAYIRLHGRKRWYNYNYSNRELQGIARFASRLANQGAKKIYILFNNDYYSYAVQNALYIQDLLTQ